MRRKPRLIPFEKLHRKWMKDPEYRREYEKLEPEFQIARALIEARIKKRMTQTEIARRARTKQPVISRLEGMESSPSISLLKRVARAVDKKLVIKFV